MYIKTLLIDLDGVLNDYTGFTDEIPKIKQGATEFLQELYNSNKYQLVLFTTRNKLKASKWLIDNKLDKYFTDITDVKIPAYLHIDDRAICFNDDFKKTINEIENFKAYWKK